MDLSNYKNDTARKSGIRSELGKQLFDALAQIYGTENVVYIPHAIEPQGMAKITGGSIAVRVGEMVDKQGFSVDVVTTISITVKPWNDTVDKRGNAHFAINFDDIVEANNAEIQARTPKAKNSE